MEKGKKEQIINELVEAFRDHKTFYLVDFKKMPVWQSVELRKTLRKHSFQPEGRQEPPGPEGARGPGSGEPETLF